MWRVFWNLRKLSKCLDLHFEANTCTVSQSVSENKAWHMDYEHFMFRFLPYATSQETTRATKKHVEINVISLKELWNDACNLYSIYLGVTMVMTYKSAHWHKKYTDTYIYYEHITVMYSTSHIIGILRGYAIWSGRRPKGSQRPPGERSGRRPEGSQRPPGGPKGRLPDRIA